jgi:hypothetical protein
MQASFQAGEPSKANSSHAASASCRENYVHVSKERRTRSPNNPARVAHHHKASFSKDCTVVPRKAN